MSVELAPAHAQLLRVSGAAPEDQVDGLNSDEWDYDATDAVNQQVST